MTRQGRFGSLLKATGMQATFLCSASELIGRVNTDSMLAIISNDLSLEFRTLGGEMTQNVFNTFHISQVFHRLSHLWILHSLLLSVRNRIFIDCSRGILATVLKAFA